MGYSSLKLTMIELGTRTYLVQHRYDEIHGVFFFSERKFIANL